MTELGFGLFKIIINRPEAIYLKPGENVIFHYWSWRKFGFIIKLFQMDQTGNIVVNKLK